MASARLFSLPCEPAGIAKWFLIVFAAGVLTFLGAPAVEAMRQGDPDVIISLALLPWMVGPAALAALRAARARSTGEAWLFVGAEVVVIASTACLGILVTFIRTGHANSEYALGLISLPIVQFAFLLIYALGVIAIADLAIAKSRHQEKPRTVLLTILSIACVVVLLVLAWLFGYIRA